jgi:hypothetical protein
MGLTPRKYTCGYCDAVSGSDRGYVATASRFNFSKQVFIYLCSNCRQPTYFDFDGRQIPGVACGNEVAALPDDIGGLYGEARRAAAVAAYTASVLACRKILMNIAVAKGAKAASRLCGPRQVPPPRNPPRRQSQAPRDPNAER